MLGEAKHGWKETIVFWKDEGLVGWCTGMKKVRSACPTGMLEQLDPSGPLCRYRREKEDGWVDEWVEQPETHNKQPFAYRREPRTLILRPTTDRRGCAFSNLQDRTLGTN